MPLQNPPMASHNDPLPNDLILVLSPLTHSAQLQPPLCCRMLHAKPTPASGPLHWLYPLPKTLFPHRVTWITSPLPSSPCSNIIFYLKVQHSPPLFTLIIFYFPIAHITECPHSLTYPNILYNLLLCYNYCLLSVSIPLNDNAPGQVFFVYFAHLA